MKYLSHFSVAAIIVLAFGLRVYKLADRPMHTDEAVQAAKFGELLENGNYQYDPKEYHGPSLNYITLIPAWLTGTKTYTSTSESLLRSVPLFFGMALVLLSLFFVRKEGTWLIMMTSFLVAISPAMVFFSRYYIHEFILVFFTYSAIYSFFKAKEQGHIRWSLFFGVSIGMMWITKETWVLSIAALLFTYLLLHGKHFFKLMPQVKFWLVGGLVAVVIQVLFFSSFFSNPHGLIDMFMTYSTYLNRAGTNDIHLQPWYYYPMLLIYKSGDNHTWSELPIVLFSMVGYYFLFFHKDTKNTGQETLKFIGVFCFLLLGIYSVLPYKTPWNLLSFYYGMILIAGFGVVQWINFFDRGLPRIIILFTLLVSSYFLMAQDYAEYENPANPSNPYVYGHTSGNFHSVMEAIDSVTIDSNTYIEVIFPGNDYWPFPWYLRKYNQVAYRNQVDFDARSGEIILISPALEDQLVEKIYERPQPGERHLYMSLFDEAKELRPGIYFYGYWQQELWLRKQNELKQND